MQQPALQVEHLKKKFGRKQVIDDITFDILPGEVFGFLGPNGAGKTTTIKMIMGLLSVKEGNILINGKDIRRDFEKAVADAGAVIESPVLYNYMTGLDNLKCIARLYGTPRKKIDEIVGLVGLGGRIRSKVKTYSLGMKQRLGIAQALLNTPKLLILDEPTNGLDPSGIHDLRDLLKMLAHEKGVAVFVSSHILSEMQQMCDRVAIIQHGRILHTGRVESLLAADNEKRDHIRIVCTHLSEIAGYLQQAYPDSDARVEEDGLHMLIEREIIPDIARSIIGKEAKLFVLEPIPCKTLEEVFLETTGGNQID